MQAQAGPTSLPTPQLQARESQLPPSTPVPPPAPAGLNLERLYTSQTYSPAKLVGAVEVAVFHGELRGAWVAVGSSRSAI